MYPWRRILVPTDFSTASVWAFDDAVRIAAPTHAEIVILHIRMTRTSRPGELRFPADDSLYEAAEKIELEKLDATVRRAHEHLQTRMIVRQAPDPGREICQAAIDEGADLIVMATHARHHVSHLFIGSTTLNVITNAHVPLLAVRYGVRLDGHFERIVVPIHLRQERRGALELAAAIARHEKSHVSLVTVCPDKDRTTAETRIKELIATDLDGVDASATTLVGDNVEREVLRHVARTKGAILFVNASEEPGPLKVDLVRNAQVPVMLVP